jgi:NAD-dependent DNA ligase
MLEEYLCNKFGQVRITSRQIDELVGLARGVAADGAINQAEVEFLQKWLAANMSISDQPMITGLYRRITDILSDGVADAEECADLLSALRGFSGPDFELGEVMPATTLPLCNPAPTLDFPDRRYCFTGVFNFGDRAACHAAIEGRGGAGGSLTKKTDVLVIGSYAAESWKHSSFGTKIIKAVAYRDAGVPIAIVSEDHWVRHLD